MKNQAYSIKRNASGERFVLFADGRFIPAAICGIAAGKDAWMRDIKAKCRDCGQLFPLRELGDSGQWCEPCSYADIND